MGRPVVGADGLDDRELGSEVDSGGETSKAVSENEGSKLVPYSADVHNIFVWVAFARGQ